MTFRNWCFSYPGLLAAASRALYPRGSHHTIASFISSVHRKHREFSPHPPPRGYEVLVLLCLFPSPRFPGLVSRGACHKTFRMSIIIVLASIPLQRCSCETVACFSDVRPSLGSRFSTY
ncbi:hypothetical protein BDV12DRAFT_88271 [Aspergillus spectabilis]